MRRIILLLSMLCVLFTGYAQQRVNGEVKDENGEPLIGASVFVKGNPSKGVVTDFDGKFVIDVPSDGALTVSYVGYITQDVDVKGKSNVIVVMKESATNLDDIVVIGYGTQRKGDITSSVASVKSEDFNKGSVKDIGQLIQGKVAGLSITNNSGDPTANTQVRLRVTFSYNSNKLESLDGSIFKSDNDFFDTGSVEYSGQNTVSHRVKVGEPIGNFWGFKVVDVDDEGRWIYEDGRTGELVNYSDFDHSGEAKQVIGNGLPKYYAGWNNSLFYKNFDLNITMRGAFGFQIINGARANYENTKNSRVENRLSSTTRLVFGKTQLSKDVEPEFNSYYVEDGDYWKIDDITLGYTFPKFSRFIQKLRAYVSVHNLCTFTKYEGVDPEVSASGLTPGYDQRWSFPTTRSFTFGINVTF